MANELAIAYLHIQHLQSNISINLEPCLAKVQSSLSF